MITYIKIDGFKSFQNFEMEFTPLTVIAGPNGSGKSNLFDALKLLSRLAETDIKTAFREQRGDPNELFTQYAEDWYAKEMSFTVEMLVPGKVKDKLGREQNLDYTRLRYQLSIKRSEKEEDIEMLVLSNEHLESISANTDSWVDTYISPSYLNTWHYNDDMTFSFIERSQNNSSIVSLTDTIYSEDSQKEFVFDLKETLQTGVSSATFSFPHIFAAREEMRSWKFLQLDPKDLREPTRQDAGMNDVITSTGKNLAAALFRIEKKDPYNLVAISRKLNNLLPGLTQVKVIHDKASRLFMIKIKGDDGREFSSRVLSEGTLRLLALCVLAHDDQHTGLLCFEEPEDGVHPFRMKAMVELLKNLTVDFSKPDSPLRQVIVNTHSPAVVNNIIHWKDDTNVSIWLSNSYTRIGDVEGKRISLKLTGMTPVLKEESDLETQTIPISENQRKRTLSEVKRFLETPASESALP